MHGLNLWHYTGGEQENGAQMRGTARPVARYLPITTNVSAILVHGIFCILAIGMAPHMQHLHTYNCGTLMEEGFSKKLTQVVVGRHFPSQASIFRFCVPR